MPPIGSNLELLRGAGHAPERAIVVGHLTDPVLGDAVVVRLNDSRRMQRLWPSPSLRLPPAA
jgi:hypothetical protein